jgi:hypothetical protein
MKKLALINSYCDTWEKLTVLFQNIKKLKELGVDSLVYSPIPLPKEITEIADYTITSKENPVINWPERGMIHWSNHPQFKIELIVPDYGWASIYQYKKLMEYGSTLDYDYYFWFLYDLNIDSIVESTLKNPRNKLFFKSTKAKNSKVGGIFASFNKENINKIHPLLNKQNYIETCKGQIAEYYIEVICDKIEGDILDHKTTDLMYEHSNLSFNVLNEKYPFKLALSTSQCKFAFYDLPLKEILVTFVVNGLYYDFTINKENPIIELDLNINNLKTILFYYNNLPINLTPYYPPHTNIIRSV